MQQILDRLAPAVASAGLTGWALVVVLVGGVLAATWWPAWRVLRLVVTLVHELGHAVVGLACGRRFTGFVLRADMSGHAVTVGPARGAGVVATTWAGYPAPALLGAGLVLVATRGWSPPALGLLLVGLLLALTRVRSVLTAIVAGLVTIATAALWWGRDEQLQHQVLVGLGVLLLIGAWRHLGALLPRPYATSDPAALTRATGIPAPVWLLSFVLVLAGASWLVVAELLRSVGA